MYVTYAADSTVRQSIAETALRRMAGDSSAPLRAERVAGPVDSATFFLVLDASPLPADDPSIHRPAHRLDHVDDPSESGAWWREADSTIVLLQGLGGTWRWRLSFPTDSSRHDGHYSTGTHQGFRSDGRIWIRTQTCPTHAG